jgi:hypothetical protein
MLQGAAAAHTEMGTYGIHAFRAGIENRDAVRILLIRRDCGTYALSRERKRNKNRAARGFGNAIALTS